MPNWAFIAIYDLFPAVYSGVTPYMVLPGFVCIVVHSRELPSNKDAGILLLPCLVCANSAFSLRFLST